MIMKKTAIAAGISAALGAGASGAFAAGLEFGVNTVNLTVLQMGSSAVQPAIQQVFEDTKVCTSGTLTIFTNGTNYTDYFCTLSSATGSLIPASLQGENLLYEERQTGGSIYGVNPVATSTAETFMQPSDCPQSTTAVPPATVACSSATGSGAPDVGISDVEPALFVTLNLPSGFSALTSSQLGSLHVDQVVEQVFQVAVGSGVSSKVTNISSSQLSSVLNGTVTDWHAINSAIAAGTKIVACLRQAGSGTQAGANAIFLHNPCSPAGELPNATAPNANYEGSTGAVKTCLNGTNTGGNSANSLNTLGILSLADGPSGADTYSTISIDGIAASAANGATGAYPYIVNSTLQYRTSLNTAAGQGLLIASLAKILSTPADLAVVNAGLPAAAFNAEQSSTASPSSPYAASNPVVWGSRQGSTCKPYVLNFPL
jgi:hypothetical protein